MYELRLNYDHGTTANTSYKHIKPYMCGVQLCHEYGAQMVRRFTALLYIHVVSWSCAEIARGWDTIAYPRPACWGLASYFALGGVSA